MRICWHGVAPWQPTGYGQQAAIWTRRLRDAGHTVTISAQGGNDTCMVANWEGIPVYPQAKDLQAVPLVNMGNLQQAKPDLVIVCYDPWQMGSGEPFKPYKTLAWVPIDTTYVTVGSEHHGPGIAVGDQYWLETSGAQPVAMSKHGLRMLEYAGWTAPLIPHGIDTRELFVPLEDADRSRLRKAIGLGKDTFAVGINAANNDRYRKSLPEQMLAFARFHAKHPDSRLFIHSQVYLPGSVHLGELARSLGLDDTSVQIANQYPIMTGTFPATDLAKWYGCMDVVMNCSRGEGFGLAAIEAQACGTPVILTNAHTGPELVGPGWLVGVQEFWNERHQGVWWTPSVKGMHDVLCKAFAEAGGKREQAREFAEGFDQDVIWPLWDKLISEYLR